MMEYLMVRENWDRALFVGLVMMIGFPALLSLYYHTRVRRFRGGKTLGRAQRNLAPSRVDPTGNLSNAAQIWRRLKSGEFGADAHRLVKHCIVASLIWVAIVGTWFGVLLYVDAQMMARGGWPEAKVPMVPGQDTPAQLDDLKRDAPSNE